MRLTGRIEIDDAYLGGERNGGKRGPRFAWQDADRGGGRNHTTRQANPIEVAPREVSAVPKSRAWRSAISIPPAPLSVTVCTASLGSTTPAASTNRSSLDRVARPP
jgi:hypothetical protein